MLSWFKNFGKAMDHTFISQVAKNCWKECFSEAAAFRGPQHHDREFWKDVFARFILKWRKMHRDAPNILETRSEAYQLFLSEVVLGRSHYPAFSNAELERIGEFIAVAIIRNLKDAILENEDRASLVIDLLPSEWLNEVDISVERFDEFYLVRTGRRRTRRH